MVCAAKILKYSEINKYKYQNFLICIIFAKIVWIYSYYSLPLQQHFNTYI